jgi:hypothetical protein
MSIGGIVTLKLTTSNYYSKKSNQEFMSVSQYKDFLKCEACAMALLNGTWDKPKSKALLLGSYVDEMLTGTKKSLEKFIEENRSELFKKNGEPYADIAQAMETVERVKKQPLMMKYLSGKHQKIMTGTIAGVPFKIRMDSYQPGEFIADLKYMASLRSPNLFEPLVKYWNYIAQGAVYQEIVYQNTGKRLPFYLVIATKESPAHLEVCEIKQYDLDEELENIKKNAPRFQEIKKVILFPERCEDYNCDYCTETKVITEPIDSNFMGMNAKQLKVAKGAF